MSTKTPPDSSWLDSISGYVNCETCTTAVLEPAPNVCPVCGARNTGSAPGCLEVLVMIERDGEVCALQFTDEELNYTLAWLELMLETKLWEEQDELEKDKEQE